MEREGQGGLVLEQRPHKRSRVSLREAKGENHKERGRTRLGRRSETIALRREMGKSHGHSTRWWGDYVYWGGGRRGEQAEKRKEIVDF